MKTRVAGIVIDGENILLLKRVRDGDLYYSAPGGKVETKENYEQTCIRELMEECSIEVRPVKEILQIVDERNGVEMLNIVYLCDYISGTPKLSNLEQKQSKPSNTYEPMWINLKDATSLNYKSKWLRKLLQNSNSQAKVKI